MPKEVLTDAYISINGVDLSDQADEVTLEYEAETEDDTTFGDDTRSSIGGLKNWSLEVSFKQNYDASKVDATLFSLVGSDSLIAVRRDSGAKASDNPEFGGRALLASYPPLGGAVGSMHRTRARFVPAKGTSGGHTLTRSTS